jgi:cyclic pyranopterin phosphate synthase
VLEGLRVARNVGFDRIRLNAVAIKGLTEPDVIPLATFAREHRFELRFIEFMPLDAERKWRDDQVLSGDHIRAIIVKSIGQLLPVNRTDPSQPAVDYRYADHTARVGFINPVSHPFCGDCNRLRLTAEGQVRNCLFSTTEWDVRDLLRSGGSDADIMRQVLDCVSAKKSAHGIDSTDFQRPQRAMYQIGG